MCTSDRKANLWMGVLFCVCVFMNERMGEWLNIKSKADKDSGQLLSQYTEVGRSKS